MSKIKRTAQVLMIFAAVLFCVLGAASADYKFDDLDTQSGIGAQWMIINALNNGNTLGNPTSEGMDVSGDLASGRNPVRVLNGKEVADNTSDYETYGYPEIQSMFLVISGVEKATADFTVNFGAPTQTDTYFGTDTVYNTNKTTAVPTGKDYYENGYEWSQNTFSLVKSANLNNYESVRTNFIFHENPESESSQTDVVPMVIANVLEGSMAGGNIADNITPLVFRTLLRDTQDTGDIAAADYFTWDVQPGTEPAGNNPWVFVPVANLPVDENEKINYRLTTSISNHTSRRYAVQRYDAYSTYQPLEASYWNFDLPYTRANDDLARRFKLNYLSHIAPGLNTVYIQSYNIREADKIPYRLFQVDPATEYYNLGLNHKVIFGKNLGKAVKTGSGKYNPFAVTAFYLEPSNPDFLANVAAKMNAASVKVPNSTNFLSSSHISYEEVTAEALRSYKIERSIPSSLLENNAEAMLPLHITFNIPKTALQSQGTNYWDTLLEKWYKDGDIHDLFAQYFSVYMLSREENTADNHWNLIEQLQDDGVYNSLMKVFMDEDRGVITVSFIVMLMDGTRDSFRPAIDLVTDKSNNATNSGNTYIILRDGYFDNIWNMTFYVAPSGFIDNNGKNENDDKTQEFPSSMPSTDHTALVTDNEDGKAWISISETTSISEGTIFYLWFSTSASDVGLSVASTSGPYAAKMTNNSGTLKVDPDYLYSDAACTTKGYLTGGKYYITYQSADGIFKNSTNMPVELASTSSSNNNDDNNNNSSSKKSGGGGGGGCNALSLGLILFASLAAFKSGHKGR